MSEVYFLDYAKGGNVLQGMKELFARSGIARAIPERGSVAVKLHMGELGNVTYIRPIFARRVADLIKGEGGRPFITDTTTLYPGGRNTPEKYLATAASNGFVEETVGAPIVIADKGDDKGVAVLIESPVDGCQLKEVSVASKIYHADALVVLSHFKGHMQTGFGGTLKNLGMGCVTSASKGALHAANTPVLDELKCDGCGICVETCERGALSLEDGKLRRDLELCHGCSTCLLSCPTGALYWLPGSKESLQVYISHAAWAVLKKFSGRAGFINIVQDVTPHCDCAAPSGRPIVQDVGILASLDPVAIDNASLDLVDRSPLMQSPPTATPPDLLGKLHGTDSLVQLRTAERLGLGSLDYRLITI